MRHFSTVPDTVSLCPGWVLLFYYLMDCDIPDRSNTFTHATGTHYSAARSQNAVLSSCRFNVLVVLRACPGWLWYHRKYINVKKGGVGGVSMLLAGYCVLSYAWNYPHISKRVCVRVCVRVRVCVCVCVCVLC